MTNRVAATYAGSVSQTGHTVSWTAPTAGSRLIVLVSTFNTVSSVSSGWTQDFGPGSGYNYVYAYSRIATAGDTSITITLSSADTRVHVTVYERDDCPDLLFTAFGTATSATSVSANATVPAVSGGRVFAVVNSPGGPSGGSITWNQSQTQDYSAGASSSSSFFASGAYPTAGAQTYTGSGLTSSSNAAGLLVIGYGTATSATLRSTASTANSTSTATSFNCNAPAGLTSGDFMLAFHSCSATTTSGMTISGGAGWTLLGSLQTTNAGSSTYCSTSIWWKVAGGSEPSTYAFGQGSGYYAAAIVAIRNAATTTPFNANAAGTTFNTTSVATPSGTPGGATDLEFRWAAGNSQSSLSHTWTPAGGYNEQADLGGSGFFGATLVVASLSSSSATGTVNCVCASGYSAYQGWTVDVATLLATVPSVPMLTPAAAAIRASTW